jgi:D-arabinose 5-phosphate isomerase GutQ
MKDLIIYYSYSGNTKTIAERLAAEQGADIIELSEIKKRSKLSAYTCGIVAAIRKKPAKLQNFNTDFSAYGKVIIAMPIWADNPPPAFNNILPYIGGKDIELVFSHGGGYKDSIGASVSADVEKNGGIVIGVSHVKGAGE